MFITYQKKITKVAENSSILSKELQKESNKNKKKVVISSANERKIDNYKIISVALTYVIIALLYTYFTHYLNESSAVNFSPPYKLFIFLLFFVVIKLAIFNLLFANDLSKLRHKSTSG